MSFLDRILGRDDAAQQQAAPAALPSAAQLATIDSAQLAELSAGAQRSVTLPSTSAIATVIDSLTPVVSNAAQAARESTMAVVKFPEGAGWADLCSRRGEDGWKLLTVKGKNGRYVSSASIKQAGLQPTAVANLALQGAAVAVGQAYMTQINDKLEQLEQGVAEIQRAMQRDRDAQLKTAYDGLRRLALKYDEYATTPEKRIMGQRLIEDALKESSSAWNYQLSAIEDFGKSIQKGKKKLTMKEVQEKITSLAILEARATAAMQLTVIAQQAGMRFDCDYSEKRIAADGKIVQEMAEEFEVVRGTARGILSGKAAKVPGAPLKVAKAAGGEYEHMSLPADALHVVAVNAARISPVNMRRTAKADLQNKRSRLQNRIASENKVQAIADEQAESLETLRFAFNEADTMVAEGETIRLLKTNGSSERA